MPERYVGFVVVGEVVTVVDAEVPEDTDDPVTIIADDTWKLQKGDRAEAYDVMYRRCTNYLKENGVARVVVKASALTMGSTKLSHMTSAELRGVVIAAAASVASVRTMSKALISRTYGNRKMDEYLQDDDFWDEQTTGGSLRKNSREAAMIVIAARNG
ncbi:MAG: hypothetical protein ABF917_13300 [Gluconobacter oxydans]|uniref:hypothetical protein n=1 Tax=Gluconobacter oxydans TaxID=442 RepID=UPI0039ED5D49